MTKHQGIHYLKTRQQGSVLIIMVLILIVGVAAVMLDSIGVVRSRPVEPDPVTKQGLVTAKEGLLAWASMRGSIGGGSIPPGQLPYPDRASDGLYDGRSDCPNGQVPSPIFRIGKLPVAGEDTNCQGLDIGSPDMNRAILDSRDSAQETIWYAVSENMVINANSGDTPPISSTDLMATTSGWLTVCDQNGRMLSNQVAFVVIAPGARLPGQNRPPQPTNVTPALAPQNFLDAFPLPAAGEPSCNNPAERNSDANEVFVVNNGLSTQFNDQLLYATKGELLTKLTEAVAKQVANSLKQYASAHVGLFPFADSTVAGNCVPGFLGGYIPTRGYLPINCTGFAVRQYMAQTTDPWYLDINYGIDPTQKTATLVFSGCSAITYQYRNLGGGQFVFESFPTNVGQPKKCG